MTRLKPALAGGALVALALVAASTPAAGQVEIGLMLSNIQSERRERECQTRPVPNESARIIVANAVNGVMARLQQPTDKDDAKAVGNLFLKKDKGFKLASTEAYLDVDGFRALLGPAGSGEWAYLVIAADAESARGVWRATPAAASDGETAPALEIGIDFVHDRRGWKILHAQAYPGEAPRVEPYCHLSNTGSF
ncbi:MAG: hypothetical protein GC145_17135 [Caulobacter sp.]|nr:hypothetical protein [Caulobacter sp.]